MRNTIDLPARPYPGLLNYREDQLAVFAGRDDDIKECSARLFQSTVLVLHGRTGCGKSSFLRAGLKPALRRAGVTFGFSKDADLQVVRSGPCPLRKIAEELFRIADDLANRQEMYGGGRAEVGEKAIAGRSREAFVQEVGADYKKAVRMFATLADALKTKPIIVIDQAEEVFTLFETQAQEEWRNAQPADSAVTSPEEKELEDARARVRREQRRYFNFLHAVASGEAPGARLILSLRTEYKGELEERISEGLNHPGDGMKSFLLEEMKTKQLLDAIERPTLPLDKYRERVQRSLAFSGGEIVEGPFEKYGFRFDKGVSAEIAHWLRKDDIPQGGLLPTMQVACLRLHRITEERARKDGLGEWVISSKDLSDLGKASEQVSQYLQEATRQATLEAVQSLRGAVAANTIEAAEVEMSAARDLCYRILSKLVRMEADGRATTARRKQDELLDNAEEVIGVRLFAGLNARSLFAAILDSLERASIIRREAGPGDAAICTLGHDSLALALNRWSLQSGGADEFEAKLPSTQLPYWDADKDQLFGEDAKTLPEYNIVVPRDLMWDHQVPFFAATRFATRLGVNFVESDELSALAFDPVTKQRKHRTWADLRTAIVDKHLDQGAGGRILVACEFQGFPATKTELGKWTDLLVTDIFLGNALIGAPDALPAALIDDNIDAASRNKRWRRDLTVILKRLAQIEGLTILTVDETSAKAALELGCDLCGVDKSWVDGAVKEVETRFSERDGLFDYFEEYRRARGTRDTSTFMLSTAFGRAMAIQAGLQAYFDADQLLQLVDERVQGDKREPEIIALAQKIMLHTIWQIGIPPSKWNTSEHKALVLRLASIGYYTADYIRSCTTEYVGFIDEWINNKVVRGTGKGGSSQLSRRVVANAVMKSFQWVTFDQYPRQVFDLEAPRAYWWKAERFAAKAAAHEIYLELCRLRALTLEASQVITQHLDFLRSNDRMNEPKLLKPLKLYKQAWVNYGIYNFYDSERYMRRAADQMRLVVEAVQIEAEENRPSLTPSPDDVTPLTVGR